MERKQVLGIVGVVAAVLGLVAVPPLLQRFYGINAVHAAFVIILIYAAVNYWLKNR